MSASHGHHEHDHHHEHSHGLGGHHHAPKDFGRAFAIGVTLNAAFVVLEAVFGFFAHSLSLIADAGHNLGDVLGLILAWVASVMVKKAASAKRTYGYRRSSILAALANAILLLITVGGILVEAVQRFVHPQPVPGTTLIWVSAAGILVNTATALLFMRGSHDLNIRGAFLHMAADAVVSLGVLLAGIVILFTGWHWLDPLMSVIIALVIVYGTWSLLVDALNLAMDAVPRSVNPEEVQQFLASREGVSGVHHLHIWGLSTTEVALTGHLVMRDEKINDALLHELNHELEDRFGITHATIQYETSTAACCPMHGCGESAEESPAHAHEH